MRFEIEVELQNQIYGYAIAFEFPSGFKELRILEEKLAVNGADVYTRELAQVTLVRRGHEGARFSLDWHLVALPIVQEQSDNDPLFVFRRWLARMLILKPIPSGISGDSDSKQETLQPDSKVSNFSAWWSGLLAQFPAVYTEINSYLKQVMPDLSAIENPSVGKDSKSLVVQFTSNQESLTLPLEDLSDGEKCFMICALVLASNKAYGPLVCFWDEPDNYLALSEVGHFVLALRKAFQSGGQFIMTSQNPEAIRRFSDENMLLLYRNNHFEPTRIGPLSAIKVNGDLVNALVRGDLEP